MSSEPVLRNFCAFILLLLLAGCASREQPFVLHVGGPEETSRYWNPPHAYAFHVQTFTDCARKERAITSFQLPPEGDFFILGYRIEEDQGPAKATLHHVGLLKRSSESSGASSTGGGGEVVGKMIVGLFFPVFVAAAIVIAPVAVAVIVNNEIHKPRKTKDVPECYTWVEDAGGAVVSGQPPFRGVGDS